MDKVLVVGAGGHGKVIGELVELSDNYDFAGWVDKGAVGEKLNETVFLGSDADLESIYHSGIHCAALGVGSVGDVSIRKKLVNLLTEIGYELVNLKHPAAAVSSRAYLSEGSCVLAGAVVQTDAIVGEHCIINSRAVIEHDCDLGAFVHVSPGAVLAGGVTVAEGAHIGLGAIVKEGISIGKGVFVAAGAVVLKDVEDGLRVAGCPARVF